MQFNLFSFLFGGVVFLAGFLAIMAWIVPDPASKIAMSWIAERRNFSRVSLYAGAAMIITFVVMAVIAVVKLLHYVQMAQWVWVALWVGLGLFLISLVMLLISRRRNNS